MIRTSACGPQPPMKVPLVDLEAQYAGIREDVLAAVTRVCDSQRFILGQEVESLERELAAMLGVTHAVGVSSGTDALLVAMMALDMAPGDEVITSTYTFFATAGSIVRLGAKPVFVDIDPLTYNMDVNRVAAAITPRTKAIVPVHLFGLSADLDPLLHVAHAAGIPVIEDACQANRCSLPESVRRQPWCHRLFLLLPQQEPRRVWRRGSPSHQR